MTLNSNLFNLHNIQSEFLWPEDKIDNVNSILLIEDMFKLLIFFVYENFSYKIFCLSKIITFYFTFMFWVNFSPFNILTILRQYDIYWSIHWARKKHLKNFIDTVLYLYDAPPIIFLRRKTVKYIYLNIKKILYHIKFVKRIKIYLKSDHYHYKKKQSIDDLNYIAKNKARVFKNHTKWIVYTYSFSSLFVYALSTYWWGLAFVTAYWALILFGSGLKLVKFSYPFIFFYIIYLIYSFLFIYLLL